jgi:hypothetical protein
MGNGTFPREFSYHPECNQLALEPAVGDYNRDGFQDIAAAMGNGN